jgi:hypothetical protein
MPENDQRRRRGAIAGAPVDAENPAHTEPAMMLTEQQKAFFQTFGYLALPGALKDDIGWIQDNFEAAWAARSDVKHDGSQRTIFPITMISGTPRLTSLLEHPVVVGAADGCIGEDWFFQGGDGNFYSGDTGWHPDTGGAQWPWKTSCRHLKVAFYLDRLTRDTGALRVIPGSHHWGDKYHEMVCAGVVGGGLGLDGRDVPSVALEITPGDLIMFDHRLHHAAYGGGNRRRMFTMNLMAKPRSEAERDAALNMFRWYRDDQKVVWKQDQRWLDSMNPACRKRLDLTVEFGDIVCAEVEPAAAT